ncbi:MAG: DNA recombination protein RmuC, partial [Hydrogenophaga sp.]|nr:DNA recombination protein RmuC [Hydrogenophaga sp.]
MNSEPILWIVVVLAAVQLLLLVFWFLRHKGQGLEGLQRQQALLDELAKLGQITESRIERVEGEIRREVGDSARSGRLEFQQTLATFQETLVRQGAETTRTQNAQIDAFAQQLVQLRGTLGDTLVRQLQDLSEANARRLAEVRATLEAQLAQLQQTNAEKLDQMRATVDEKLHATLEARLGESFR